MPVTQFWELLQEGRDVEELLDRKPVRLPRWLLGTEAHGWAPYEDQRHEWFTLTAEDVLTAA
jgi:hypothetical protein